MASPAPSRRSAVTDMKKKKGTQASMDARFKKLKKAAQDSHSGTAQYELAALYEERGELQKAIKYYTKSAEGGHTIAQMALGERYGRGRCGLALNEKEALKYYKKAANGMYPAASFAMACLHFDGSSLPPRKVMNSTDRDLSFRSTDSMDISEGSISGSDDRRSSSDIINGPPALLRRMSQDSNDNNSGPISPLAINLSTGSSENENLAKLSPRQYRAVGLTVSPRSTSRGRSLSVAVSDLSSSSERREHTRSKSNTAVTDTPPVFVDKDNNTALDHLRTASDMGHVLSMYSVWGMHWLGLGDAKEEEALKWLNKAAEKKNPEAVHALGWVKYHGLLGEEQNRKGAVSLWQQGATLGNVESAYNLAVCHANGDGTDSADLHRAKAFYLVAAEKGLVEAQYNLGVMCLGNGLEVKSANQTADPKLKSGVNYTDGLKWLTRAATDGCPDGMLNLAYMHQNGLGTRYSLDSVIHWMKKYISVDMNDASVHYYLACALLEKADEIESSVARAGSRSSTDLRREASLHMITSVAKGYVDAVFHCGVLVLRGAMKSPGILQCPVNMEGLQLIRNAANHPQNPSVCARVEMARLCALVYTTRGGHEQEAEEPVWEERLALAEKFMRLLEEETDKDAIAETVQGEDGRRDMWGRRAYAWLSLVGDELVDVMYSLGCLKCEGKFCDLEEEEGRDLIQRAAELEYDGPGALLSLYDWPIDLPPPPPEEDDLDGE